MRYNLDDIIPSNYLYMSNDATRNIKAGKQNAHLDDIGSKGMKALGTYERYLKKDHPNLYAWRDLAILSPFLVAGLPMAIGGAQAIGSISPIAAASSAISSKLGVALPLAMRALEAGAMYNGAKDLIHGKFTPETALELSPAYFWKKALNFQNFRNVVFDNKIPFKYDGALNATKNIAKDMISLKTPNPLYPKWENEARDYSKKISYMLKKDYGIDIPADAMYNARRDAWAMHNRIPQLYDSFEEIGPNTYRAKNDINRILDTYQKIPHKDPNTGLPITSNGVGWDWFNSSGGGVSREYQEFASNPLNDGSEEFAGVIRQLDYNDYQPFLKKFSTDAFESSGDIHSMIQNKVGDFIQSKIRRPLFDKGILGYQGKAPKWIQQLENKTLNKWRYTMPFDNKIKKISDWLSPKIRDFEVADITRGNPFYVINEMPISGLRVNGDPIVASPGWYNYGPGMNDIMKDYIIDRRRNGYYKPFKKKNGGSIHINPSNRGKFNATKARTGKTTEELTHSPNPLTRKRAIFAQNARKWKH